MNKLLLSLGVLLLLLNSTPTELLAANEQISFTSAAEIEVIEVNDKGEKVLVRRPAVLVPPGGVVIYVNAFTNNGNQPAEELVVTNPVPADTEYLRGSATETGADLSFSIDGGKNFGKPEELMVPDGEGGTRQAEPKEYTDIRWLMQESLEPGATGIVEFRVRVK
jgi:uncharacterized repeat protein (TIGR01451 family)